MNQLGDTSKLQDRLPSEDRFRLLFEDAPVAYHEIDNQGRITRVNRAECAMLGYDPHELVGMLVWDLTSPEDREQFRDSVELKLSGTWKVEPFQGRFLRKDGAPVTIEFYENLIEDESGGITGIRGILINITEREEAMEVILASESKFRELFDNVLDGVFQTTADGRILTANPALLKMLGYHSEAEFLQVDIETALYIHPERRAARIAQLERDGELRNCELQLRTRDGRQITVLENSRAVRDADGAVSYYEGTLTDITGRVEAQEALTEERDFTSAIIDSAGSLIVVLRPDGRIIRFNRACEQTSGYSFEEVEGRPFWDVLIVPAEMEPLKEIFRRLRQGADSIRHENHWRSRTGELRLIEWSNVVLRDKQGAAAYVISTGIDITERRRAEQALRISEQRYRDLFENAHDVVYAHDLRGAFMSLNAAAERITGYTRGEALRMNMSEIVAPDMLSTLQQMINSKLGGEGPTTYELDIIAKDGRRVSLEVSARLQLEDGKPIGIHGVARDITDRKIAEAKLESYASELARKNEELADALTAAKEGTELKSRFLATMSHEIRTPMNGVLGMTELLMSTPLDTEQRDYAQAVRHSAEALLVVINDILDISKIEAGKLNLERLPFDPSAVVDEVIGLLAPRAAAKGLRLTCETQGTLPRVVRGDPGRLRQILLNLIGNAVKFTEEGEVAVSTLVTGSTAETATVQFSVRDTGIGISPEKGSRLFQSFVQGDSSTTRKYGGTGLGLAISKQLVEMMGGVIEFESELGRGSTFTFLVAFEKFSPEACRAAAGGAGVLSLAGCKTLVVDQTSGDGPMTREYLETLGCRADLSCRTEALDRLRRAMAEGDPYRIALLDLSSPEPEIFSLSLAIGSDPAIADTIRICCVEPPLRGEDRLKSFGFSGALQKPITPWALQDTLIAALEGTTAS
jgi:two-component system sensor histidine kinase/response regulator